MLGKQNQDPTQNPRRSVERRARGAALVGAIGLPVWVLGMSARAASAQPDAVGHNSTPDLINNGHKQAAAPEAVQQAEQSPQAFIDTFDTKLAREVQLMHSSPYFSSEKNEALSKALHTAITIDFVSAPSKQYPGRYDQLTVIMAEGEAVPRSVDVTLGSDAKSYKSVRHYESQSNFVQADNFGKFSHRTMSLESVDPLTRPVDIRFLVSSEGYPVPKTDADTIKYPADSAKVSTAYNVFLKKIQDVATRK